MPDAGNMLKENNPYSVLVKNEGRVAGNWDSEKNSVIICTLLLEDTCPIVQLPLRPKGLINIGQF